MQIMILMIMFDGDFHHRHNLDDNYNDDDYNDYDSGDNGDNYPGISPLGDSQIFSSLLETFALEQ